MNFGQKLPLLLGGNLREKHHRGGHHMRKSYSKEFKAKVAFEAMREDKTLAELSKMYDVHPNIIRKWKEQGVEAFPDAFSRGKSFEQKDFEAKEAEYLKTIGQLMMERDFLKRAFTKIQPELKKKRKSS